MEKLVNSWLEQSKSFQNSLADASRKLVVGVVQEGYEDYGLRVSDEQSYDMFVALSVAVGHIITMLEHYDGLKIQDEYTSLRRWGAQCNLAVAYDVAVRFNSEEASKLCKAIRRINEKLNVGCELNNLNLYIEEVK